MAPRYQGFTLKSVCWGYRDVFERAIEELFAQDLLGPQNEGVTRSFFELLKKTERNLFDHVLYDFLRALNPETQWIITLPAVFSDVTEMGCRLAETRIYYGTTFFRLLGEGGLGNTPEQVTHLMTLLRRLTTTDPEAAFSLLKGYGKLSRRLTANEIDRYVDEGLAVYSRSRKTGLRFLEGSLQSSQTVIQMLSQECTLTEMSIPLTRLVKALSARRVEIESIGILDADYLADRGSSMVALYRWLYLPSKMRRFKGREANASWYNLQAIVAAALFAIEAFPIVHGHREYATCRDLVGRSVLLTNLYQIIEYVRALAHIREHWPGARGLLDWGLAEEEARAGAGGAERLFFTAARSSVGQTRAALVEWLTEQAPLCNNLFAAADLARELAPSVPIGEYPGIEQTPLGALSIFPDFLYRGEVEVAPPDSLVADLKEKAARGKRDQREPHKTRSRGHGGKKKQKEDEVQETIKAGFVYDEWSEPDHDYLPAHCLVHQIPPDPDATATLPADITEQARRTRRIFEWLKPATVRKEKYLEAGDVINSDLLLEFLINRRREPNPPMRFYQKPRVRERDLGTLILVDVSGSTGEEHAEQQIIEIERNSALILGQGLSSLGDRFAICGFSGQGRENCEYYVYKGFDDEWDSGSIGRILAAGPRSSTRIGAALRHSGYLLAGQTSRQKLVVLITDGRPMDSGYDPESRYAQFDVRMACEENRRNGIHTFAISTEKNSRADMELMFPQRRFAILPSIDQLPAVLPRLYMRLTT